MGFPGTEYGSLAELTEVPGTVARAYRTLESSGYLRHTGVHNSQKSRACTNKNVVPVPRVLRDGRTEPAEVPGTGMSAIRSSQKLRVRV